VSDELRTASFRGVEFHVDGDVGVDRGRRAQVHEYVGRDEPYVEDLGRKARPFTVPGYVLGEDAIDQARRLADACEAAGSATLVHPWLGELTVVCTGCRERHSTRRRRRVDFELEFQQTFAPVYPAATADHATAVDQAALTADEAALRQLADELQTDGLPQYVADDAGGVLGKGLGGIRETLGPLAAKAKTYAAWTKGILRTASDAATLVRSPMAAGERLLGLLDLGNVTGNGGLLGTGRAAIGAAEALRGNAGAPQASWRQYLPLFGWSAGGAVQGATRSRQVQAANRAAIERMVRQGAVVQAARAATREDFQTYEDAQTARRAIAGALDDEMQAAPDATYAALRDLRAATVRAIAARSPELPRLTTIMPATTRPAVAIAYDRFGDDVEGTPEQAAAIVARNRVRHPLFVPGGTPLSIVVSA
jgi:prophage DNA circulation protein